MPADYPITSHFNKADLKPNQRGALGMLFSKAYQRAVAHHATDDLDPDEWRHEQCRRMCGVTIKEAKQMHYLHLKMYGEDLCGNSGKAFAVAMQIPGEECRRIRALVEAAMTKWELSWGYMQTVIKGKFAGKSLDDLCPFEWEQLLYTANNRGKALRERKAGTWDGSKRNKKQSKARSAEDDRSKMADGPSADAPYTIGVDLAKPRQENEPVSYWQMISGGRAE